MKHMRTHLWLCITLNLVLLTAFIMSFFPIRDIVRAGQGLPMDIETIQILFVSVGSYFLYTLVILFMLIKYVPERI